jgi:hypothetical protein
MTTFALATSGPKGSMPTRVSTRPFWEPFADNGWYFTRVCANVFAPPRVALDGERGMDIASDITEHNMVVRRRLSVMRCLIRDVDH